MTLTVLPTEPHLLTANKGEPSIQGNLHSKIKPHRSVTSRIPTWGRRTKGGVLQVDLSQIGIALLGKACILPVQEIRCNNYHSTCNGIIKYQWLQSHLHLHQYPHQPTNSHKVSYLKTDWTKVKERLSLLQRTRKVPLKVPQL